MSEEAYHHNIARIHEYLRNGDCYQINLAQRFKAKYKGDEWNAFLALLDRNGAPFSSFIRLPKMRLSVFHLNALSFCKMEIFKPAQSKERFRA